MSMHVLTPETVLNRGLLEFPTAPRKILERGMLLPRREASRAFVARAILENQMLRFTAPLLPFVVAAILYPHLALPIAQGPIPMLLLISVVEMRVLRVPYDKRKSVTTEEAAARALDTLAFRGRRILAELAAARGIETGIIYLVVEQSDLARVPPMTVVSVQLDHGTSRLVALTQEERQIIKDGLFDADFTERDLLKANLREGETMRSVAFEARGVSAHARLAAFLDKPAEAASL